MSGNSPTPFIMAITSNTIPPEGSKCYRIKTNWNKTSTGIIGLENYSLLQAFMSGQFSTCQAVFVDNSTNCYEVWLKCNETEQTILCPAYTQGMWNIACAAAPTFQGTLIYVADPVSGNAQTNSTTRFTFFNTAQQPYINPVPMWGNNYNNVNGSFVMIDKTLTQILPALPQYNQYLIMSLSISIFLLNAIGNGSNGTLYLAEMGNSASGSLPSNNSWIRFQQQWSDTSNTAIGLVSQNFYTFVPPIKTSNNNVTGVNALGFYCSISDGVGISVTYNMVFGTVVLT